MIWENLEGFLTHWPYHRARTPGFYTIRPPTGMVPNPRWHGGWLLLLLPATEGGPFFLAMEAVSPTVWSECHCCVLSACLLPLDSRQKSHEKCKAEQGSKSPSFRLEDLKGMSGQEEEELDKVIQVTAFSASSPLRSGIWFWTANHSLW